MTNIIHTHKRTVLCEDAKVWLEKSDTFSDSSLVASLPDISEFPSHSLELWKQWFIETASLILSRTPDNGVTIFYQSDIKLEGKWIDKGFLCQKAAESVGADLLWHKVACRSKPGQTTFSRCSYSHILCFSRGLKVDISKSTADVIPDIGEKTWPRGMGFDAAMMIAKFIATQTASTNVVNPFCGQGSILAAANAVGLSAIGIERSPKRAKAAQALNVNLETKRWIIAKDSRAEVTSVTEEKGE